MPCRMVAMTWKTSARSSSVRQPLEKPQAASAVTHRNGTRSTIARRTMALAITTLGLLHGVVTSDLACL